MGKVYIKKVTCSLEKPLLEKGDLGSLLVSINKSDAEQTDTVLLPAGW